jgi:iron complex outermembrane receptor protein
MPEQQIPKRSNCFFSSNALARAIRSLLSLNSLLGVAGLVALPVLATPAPDIWTSTASHLQWTDTAPPADPDAPPSLEDLLGQPTSTAPEHVEISTAARYAQRAGQASQLTYVMTAEEITRLGLRNLGEILSFLPGLHVSTDGTYGYLTARGIGRPGDYNARLMFLLNGSRVNDNIYDAGFIGSNFYIDSTLIERVEYSPGSGSALYGGNALLGVVNVITKTGYDLQGMQLSATQSNQHVHDLSLSYGIRDAEGHDGWVAFNQVSRDHIGISNSQTPELRSFTQLNQDQIDKVAASYRYRRLQLQLAGVDRKRHEPSLLSPDQQYAASTQLHNRNGFIALAFSHPLSHQLEWQQQVSTNRFDLRSNTPFWLAANAPAIDPSLNIASNIPTPAQMTTSPSTWSPTPVLPPLGFYRFHVEGKWTNIDQRFSWQPDPNHHWLFGVDIQRDHHQEYQLNMDGYGILSAASSDNLRQGVYLQHEWQLQPQHRLVTGLRHDHIDNYGEKFSPKIAWLWQRQPTQQWRLSYGKAFRAANEYEQETSRFFQLNEPNAELASTMEVSWRQQLQPQLRLQVNLYHAQLDNLITGLYAQQTLTGFYNDHPIRSRGVETQLDYSFSQNTAVTITWSVQDAYYQDANDSARQMARWSRDLTNSPRHLFKAQAKHAFVLPWLDHSRLSPELWLHWRLYAASERLTSALQAQHALDGFVRQDLLLSWQATPQWFLNFGVKNLTDTAYQDAPLAGGIPLYQPGRSVELSLRWTP